MRNFIPDPDGIPIALRPGGSRSIWPPGSLVGLSSQEALDAAVRAFRQQWDYRKHYRLLQDPRWDALTGAPLEDEEWFQWLEHG